MSAIPFSTVPFDPSLANINKLIGQINQSAGLNVQGASGLSFTDIPLLQCRNTDGSAIAAAAAAGKFGVTLTAGTALALISEAANSNTKTDDAVFEYTLPQSYVAGSNFTVTVNLLTTGAGTLTVHTVQVKAYRQAQAGSQGANMGPAAASFNTGAANAVTQTITGATLNPGDKIMFVIETVITETAASNTTCSINSIVVGP